MATDIEGRQPLGTPFGNPLQGVNVSQQPVDLGGGFEDPMDPCTMCMQGQQEIQQAYNELTQSCNACQTQQNLTNLQQQGCQGCAQAQQVIQKVQQQSTGCQSCGTQSTNFQPMMQQSSSQQPMQPFLQNIGSQQQMPFQGQLMQTMQQPSQGLVQPMLTPLVGTGQNILTTVNQQPGMIAGQLPISIERGPTSQITPQQQHFVNGQLMTSPMQGQQLTVMPTQPMVMQMPLQQFGGMPGGQPAIIPGMQPILGGSQQPAPINVIPSPPPAPVQQPVMQPTQIVEPASQPVPVQVPVQQPAPVFSGPQLSPAQTQALEAYAQSISRTGTPAAISITGPTPGGVGGGYGAGPGKGLTGQGTTINLGPEGFGGYQFQGSGGGLTYGGTGGGVGGVGGIGAPGAFDVHRPDLHAGGGWHMTLPLGTEGILNLY